MAETKKIRAFKDARGMLFEVLRKDDKLFEGKFGQVLVSVNKPGVVKAWHLHKKQTDYTCCIKGKILFATAKEKKGKTKVEKWILSGDDLKTIKVPKKTWHGYKVLGKKEAIVVYIMDVPYNAKQPDEERKPEDAFGKNRWRK